MRSRSAALLAVATSLALTATSSLASAQTVLTANLTNGQEVPPTVPTLSTGPLRPASFGTATFTINAAMTEMSFVATIFNVDVTGAQTPDVNDNLTNAHIHVGALPGFNAPVRWGFFGSPQNNIDPSDGMFTPFASGVGGTFSGTWNATEGNGGTTFATNLPLILAGQAYINFHTVQFAGGEIRGQLTVVPEPATVLLTAAGIALLGLVQVRRRRNHDAGA